MRSSLSTHIALTITTLCLFTPLAASQAISESRKLTAPDAAAGDEFGTSVATYNGITAVGAVDADGKENIAGAAYIFDQAGNQLHKLIADDGSQVDNFGNAVALNDTLVVVGSSRDRYPGENGSGSAYVFDLTTGAQLHKLIPPETDTYSEFGISVAIENNTIAIGAYGFENGGHAGSVYIYDATTGEQLHKLLANDGENNNLFGHAVDIHNNIVAVGAHLRDDFGFHSGAAYLFDATTGTQIYKLLPDDGVAEAEFGFSVAIHENLVAVGAPNDNEIGQFVGAAYLFDATTGTQLTKILPDINTGSDQFGHSISVSEEFVAIGAIYEGKSASRAGAAYIYDPSTYLQIAKLVPTDERSGDEFGNSIATDKATIAVGAYRNDDAGSSSGSAYIFHALPTTPESQKLTPPDPAPNDLFGRSMSIHNSILAIGVRNDDDNGSNSGSAHLFDTTTGTQLHKLLPNDGAQGDQFGSAIAIDQTTAIVGAWRDDDLGSNSGSAYLFDTTTGSQITKLLPNDGQANDNFGFAVAIDQSIAVVGSILDDDNANNSGSAYLFDTATGTQLHKLLPDDPYQDDQFGYAVAIENNLVAVGAIMEGDDNLGAVYLFDATTGTQIAKLTAEDRHDDDQFGGAIAIDNNTIAVGAHLSDARGTNSGAAYLFDATTGTQIAKLSPQDGSPFDFFGFSIDIHNNTVVVGNWRDDANGTDSGSAYLFDATTGEYIAKLLPTDGQTQDQFGYAVAIENTTIAASAWRSDTNGNDSGAAYIFNLNTTPPCPADLNNDTQLDFFDISAFLTLFSTNDPAADFNNDTNLDFFDLSAFLAAFAAGCP